MKELLFTLVALLLPMLASAEAVEINGIYYNLTPEDKVAEVTENPNKYKGEVVIPESVPYNGVDYSVSSIGENAFKECSELTALTIPGSVTSIGKYAFQFCDGLTSVNISDLDAWCKISFHSSPITPYHLFLNGQEITDLIIPNSVTSIGKGTFKNCTGLTSVNIPNSVTTIGDGAFMYCTGLTSLTIPNSVTTIGHETFENCSGLTNITIGNGVTTIGGETFKDCKNLTYVVIGNSLTSIGGQSFGNSEKLTDVYCYAEAVPTADIYTFKKTPIENATLHVPAASVDNYKNTAPWSDFGAIVALNGEVGPVLTPKCETPTISFVDGKLTFSCKTDDVKYVSKITASDAKNYYDSSIALTNKYVVSVYAIKEGYENSETATLEISASGGKPGDANEDGTINAADIVTIVNIIMGQ